MFFKKSKKKQRDLNKRLEDQAEAAQTIIASNTKIKGKINGESTLRIKGYLDGQINTKGLVWVDKEGRVDGYVNARGIIIEGEMNGDIEASEKIEIRSESRVVGNISCSKIAIADGCVFQGEIHMPGEGDKPYTFKKKRKGEISKTNRLNPFN